MGVKNINYTDNYSSTINSGKNSDTASDNINSREKFASALQKFIDDNKLTAEELKQDKDWRDLSDDEWDDLLEHIDEYIDDYKEHLKELKEAQDEAAQKAASEADPSMRTTAASSAALKVASNGVTDGFVPEGDPNYNKNWTKNLKTEDQAILRTAQRAQEMESMAMSKFQEVQLTGDTSEGVTKTEGTTECATSDEDKNGDVVWTVTAFTPDGIISKKFKNGKEIECWEIKYDNPSDAQKVWDYLNQFDDDTDWTFAGEKAFWQEFLSK